MYIYNNLIYTVNLVKILHQYIRRDQNTDKR